MTNETSYSVEAEYLSIGPIAATANQDGSLICIDFANIQDTTKALRLAFPSSQIENLKAALSHIQQALADPASGIRFPPPH